MKKRDLKADLEWVRKATKVAQNAPSQALNRRLEHAFVEKAREGWPHAIERAISAESLVRELAHELENLFQLHENESVMDWKERYIVRQLLYKAKEVLNAD